MEPIVVLQDKALQDFLDYLTRAAEMDSNGPVPFHTLRIAIDEGGVKVKVNGYTWTPAMGEVQ